MATMSTGKNTPQKRAPAREGEGQRETQPTGQVFVAGEETAGMQVSEDSDDKKGVGLQPVAYWLPDAVLGKLKSDLAQARENESGAPQASEPSERSDQAHGARSL